MPANIQRKPFHDLYLKLPRQLAERLHDVRIGDGSYRVVFLLKEYRSGFTIFEDTLTVAFADWLTDASIALICLQVP